MKTKIIEMNHIVKSFGHVQAIQDGHFDLVEGEIHSLVGENGAGKSTLMKIAYGMQDPDSGKVMIRGKEVSNFTPKKAIESKIGMVHQEFMLVKELTVIENIILGFEPHIKGRIDYEKAYKEINHYIKTYDMNVDLEKKVMNLPVGEAQKVEILKILYRGADVLILDEPTAVLTPQETLKLFEILNLLKEDGKSIIFISHKLKEVMDISDRISVMRGGKYIDTVKKEETTIPEIAKKMVGREVFLEIKKPFMKKGNVVLEVKNVSIPSNRELSKIRNVSFDISAGEILGFAGVDGNGQTELIEGITGLRNIESGEVIFKGKSIKNISPLQIRKSGIAHIPEDRNLRGLNKEWSIRDNLIANDFYKKPFAKKCILDNKEINSFADLRSEQFDIRPRDINILTGQLSGGNAQKVIVAREVGAETELLIAAQPTRGVDIGSIEEIRKYLMKARMNNSAILLVSADLEEIMSLSDKIAVLYEGKIVDIVDAAEADIEKIGLMMTGGKFDEVETQEQ
ncbi:ABC transporter ATP-binding protein [Clostridium formicaceticum]|uniref:ABC transporter ATP-binding protein n=1 Tax=Clostridium formicaceticum TaxID=1497 RepID=A0AAC9RMG1_9CLOT|nr:ABC transporter ATP-binding protein [Clostridium formicaceticum]AOY76557.1 ABC transporter ATP-binding protein [Clostridium formicaceticum]ARE86975.1 Galactose/methyl galactoside import ATP-binding protein MglA [Clostridium formicaceticum]